MGPVAIKLSGSSAPIQDKNSWELLFTTRFITGPI